MSEGVKDKFSCGFWRVELRRYEEFGKIRGYLQGEFLLSRTSMCGESIASPPFNLWGYVDRAVATRYLLTLLSASLLQPHLIAARLALVSKG